jgi:hypothetical protein
MSQYPEICPECGSHDIRGEEGSLFCGECGGCGPTWFAAVTRELRQYRTDNL